MYLRLLIKPALFFCLGILIGWLLLQPIKTPESAPLPSTKPIEIELANGLSAVTQSLDGLKIQLAAEAQARSRVDAVRRAQDRQLAEAENQKNNQRQAVMEVDSEIDSVANAYLNQPAQIYNPWTSELVSP